MNEPLGRLDFSAQKTLRYSRFAFAVASCLFTLVFFANAWVGDDAYITFRTIDNFVNGYGLRWNVIERVQTYTHPLWLIVCSVPYYFTHEVYYTVILVSYVVCLSTLLVYQFSVETSRPWTGAVVVLALLASKTFMDYSSSGLENGLSALLGVSFVVTAARADRDITSPLSVPLGIAGLAALSRLDTLLIYIVACALLIVRRRGLPARLLVRDVVLGMSPVILWCLFSLVYYGFVFPNTAYAKALVSGVPLASRLKQGFAYLLFTALWDPIVPVMMLVFFYVAIRSRSALTLAVAAGVVMYAAYVVAVAASSSTMGLRFFSVVFVVAVATTLLAIELFEALTIGAVAVVFMVVVPLSPVRTLGCRWSAAEPPLGWKTSAILDIRALGCRDGAALANFQRNTRLPDHPWFKSGLEFRQTDERVHLGGPGGLPAMGYFGYSAGPGKVIVDPFGLTDPLLARLPATVTPAWLPGEISRPTPPGYLESLQQDANVIVDPSLHQYYESLRTIVSGPIFSARRWKEILAMNLGLKDDLVRRYEAGRKRVLAAGGKLRLS